MRAVLQRVQKGQVTVAGEVVGKINAGLVILLGVEDGDTQSDLNYITEKCLNLRIFSDSEGKFNFSLLDIKGEILCISQFTLFADCRKGRRPSFVKAGKPEYAKKLYLDAIAMWQELGIMVQCGEFGRDMVVSLDNDGPVTIILDSKER